MTDIDQVLKFIDTYTTESQLYFQVATLYDKDTRFEVQWVGDKKWRFKKVKETFWTEIPTTILLSELSTNKVDLVEFEMQVRTKAIEQIVGAQFIVDSGRELFGDQFVDQQIDNFKKFQETLAEAITQVLEKREKKQKQARLTVIKSDE